MDECFMMMVLFSGWSFFWNNIKEYKINMIWKLIWIICPLLSTLFCRVSSADISHILGNLEEISTFQQMLVQSLEEHTKLVFIFITLYCIMRCQILFCHFLEFWLSPKSTVCKISIKDQNLGVQQGEQPPDCWDKATVWLWNSDIHN